MTSPSTRGSSPTATAVDRRIQIVRNLSGELAPGACSLNAAPRRFPLSPLPPPVESPISQSSFGSPSDEELQSVARHRLKRARSFHSSGSRLLRQGSLGANSPFAARPRADTAPSGGSPLSATFVQPAPPASFHAPADTAFRPPPIRTMASLEPFADSGGGDSGGDDGRASVTPSISSATSIRRPPSALSMFAAATPSTPAPRFGCRRSCGFGGGGFAPSSSRQPVPAMSLVAPNLFVGDEHAAANLAGLSTAGVTHVLNCTAASSAHLGEAGAPLHYLQLNLLDSTADLPRMQEAIGTGVEFIAQALASGGAVLVHCHRGISRSATIAIAYLIRQTRQPAEVVFEHVRAKRRIVDPNLGYMVSLKEWERRVLPPSLLRVRSLSVLSPALLPGQEGGGVRPLSRAG